MQSGSSLHRPTVAGHRTGTDEAPILNKPQYQDPLTNPGVAFSDSVAQSLTKNLSWTLCILFGIIIFITSLHDITTAFSPLMASADDWGETTNFMLSLEIHYARPVIWVFGVLVFTRLADVYSRPTASVTALTVFTLGSVIAAAAPNVSTLAVGVLLHMIASAGISNLVTLFIADHTPLKWRGLVLSLAYFPYIINMWVAPRIQQNLNWRWHYGLFVIIIPLICAPALAIMFLVGFRQKSKPPQVLGKLGRDLMKMDLLGLLLFVTGFALTKYGLEYWRGYDKEYPSRIMLALGLILLFPCLFAWEAIYAPFPLMPKSVLNTRGVKCAVLAAFFSQLASRLAIGGFNKLLSPALWNANLYGYMLVAPSMANSVSAPIFGLVFLLTQRYKLSLLVANGFFILGVGLMVHCARTTTQPGSHPPTSLIVVAQILSGIGRVGVDLGLSVGSQASVSYDNLATVIALIIVWPSVADILYGRISSEILVKKAIWENSSYVTILSLALGMSFACLIFSLFMPNYVLGSTHNMAEEKSTGGERGSGDNETRPTSTV